CTAAPRPAVYSVKEAVLPFLKFPGVQPVLGPEMRSTGESMGIDADPHLAYYRAALGAGSHLPDSGVVRLVGEPAKELEERFAALGFTISASWRDDGAAAGTEAYDLLIEVEQSSELRRALENGVPYVSTIEAGRWTLAAMETAAGARSAGGLGVS